MLKDISGGVHLAAPGDQIKNEPMVFSASPEFARDNGGDLTRFIVDRLEAMGHFDDGPGNVVIDTRVHMLMRGMFPAIGGWHCDAVPRGGDGQPDFTQTDVINNIRHYLVVVDAGTGSLTEFITERLGFWDLTRVPGENVWGMHSALIAQQIERGVLRQPKMIESGKLYQFDARDYHRAIPATGNGWRYFFRASLNTKTRGPLNEIRNQVQVYLPTEHLGW